ncbi:alkaline phosphatase [Paenibacillus sp. TRM 82003]|nr:alkaline phosphatase [Paenibacillus sp. TRM 82003]
MKNRLWTALLVGAVFAAQAGCGVSGGDTGDGTGAGGQAADQAETQAGHNGAAGGHAEDQASAHGAASRGRGAAAVGQRGEAERPEFLPLQDMPIPHTDRELPFRDSENADLRPYGAKGAGGLTSANDVGGAAAPNGESDGLRMLASPANGGTPKNVIVMVGDGMGLGQIEVARLLEHGKDGRLFMQSLPHVALSQTYSANNFVTDSAAAGTAIATGFKTNNESIGVNTEGDEVDSILDAFKAAGKKVGVVSTNTATDATPAAFSASVANRWSGQQEVARQMFDSQVDVILGGGASYFSPARQEGVDLTAKFREAGYAYAANRDELLAATGDKLLGLFHPSYMNYKLDRDEVESKEPTLTEMARKTIEVLSKGDQGFFAMIEGARIDHAAHAADIAGIWTETVEFDDAVRYVTEWAQKRNDTLVVVLADHETMGIAASEAMDVDGLKRIGVTPEYMAAQLAKDEATGQFDPQSVKDVFKTYANIELTDDEVAVFQSRVLDTEGKVYASYRVGWEIGSIIAERHHVSVMDTDVRSLSSTGGHTGNMVPIFSYGVGAERLEGIFDNTEVPKEIASIAGVNLNPTKVLIDGRKAKMAAPPIIVNQRVLLPVRDVSELLGAQVGWDDETRQVSVKKDASSIFLTVGATSGTVNGEARPLDQSILLRNDKVYVPFRFIGEALGAQLNWDPANNAVEMKTKDAAEEAAAAS